MNIALFLKNNLKYFPTSVGRLLNIIPYSLRPGIGKVYRVRKSQIYKLDLMTILQKQEFVFTNMKRLVEYAENHVLFYKSYYSDKGFDSTKLKSFDDISKIPVITKAVLNEYSLKDRSSSRPDRYIVNTGGSSGTPFGFYIQPSSMGHEWAHMHTIWNTLGYKHTDLKVVFGGRSDVKNLLDYDVVRNHFAIDIYADYAEVSERFKKVIKKYEIKYLHGYPSSIYDFAVYCEQKDSELLEMLRKMLRGAFLGSEFPHQHYRTTIERVFDIPTISWYGHTERAVLAYERVEPFVYEPFLTYGFAEALPTLDGNYNLIGTSYYNYASPLIRYNTEDTVTSPVITDGILEKFEIKDGRSGEFVIDRSGKLINLTALIFGRHHDLFNHTKFIQVGQKIPGDISIYFVSEDITEDMAAELFDSNNLNFDVTFKKVTEPIRTGAGKIGLLVK